jgi:hypothetical protein
MSIIFLEIGRKEKKAVIAFLTDLFGEKLHPKEKPYNKEYGQEIW